ncbi:MAG: transporter permease [Rubritepida sp.]|nr:transporter permease [Rubritepida sp.]
MRHQLQRTYDASRPQRWSRAREDILLGLARWRLAWALARSDIMHRYRGSVLGPFWLTLSTGVMLAALGFLYAKLFRMEISDYLPWLAVSLIVWNIMAQIATDACAALTNAEGILRQMPLPYSVQAIRTVLRSALVAAHNLPLIAVVFLVFGYAPGWGVFAALPGLALLAVNAFWASLLLGMICARFRDIPPIVASVMQIAFFVTPVMWKPELVGAHWAVWLPLNPFFSIMEIVRAPLMGGSAPLVAWVAALAYSLLLWGVAQVFFTRFRERIAFWV